VVIDAPRARRLRTTLEATVGMPVVAFATLFALWPRMWAAPIGALADAFKKLSIAHSREPFLGEMTNSPGVHYFVVYLLATLPVGVLVGVLAWIVRASGIGSTAGARVVRASGIGSAVSARRRATLIMIAWLVIPLAVSFSPVVQDGVRYVMPCVLGLALAAAAGWDRIAIELERRWRHAFAAIVAALGIYLAITAYRIHPYYLDYFGEQVGGAGTVTAHHWFETAWWGEGVDRAVDYVNEHAEPGAHVFRDCIEPAHLAWFRAGLWVPMAHTMADADWIVTYSPATHHCPVPKGFDRVFTVDADGAILAEVWKR
jgi:hypothetical protein